MTVDSDEVVHSSKEEPSATATDEKGEAGSDTDTAKNIHVVKNVSKIEGKLCVMSKVQSRIYSTLNRSAEQFVRHS